MKEEQEAKLRKVTAKVLFNLREYYETYGSPLLISKAFQSHASTISRSDFDWSDVEHRLRNEEGVRVILSPQNKKYLFPKEAVGEDEDLRELVLELDRQERETERQKKRGIHA